MNSFDSGNFATQILIAVAIIAIAFLIFREVVCWYWKINQSIGLLKEIRDSLAIIAMAKTGSESSETSVSHTLSNRQPNTMTSATEFSAMRGIALEEVIEKLRSGALVGKQIDGVWYLAEGQ